MVRVRKPLSDPFAALYVPRQSERNTFGEHWCGPERYEHGEEHLVARYEAKTDGQPVEIYCVAMPARFYIIKALPGCDGLGKEKPTWEGSTGSSCERLAADIATAVSESMLTIRPTVAVDTPTP